MHGLRVAFLLALACLVAANLDDTRVHFVDAAHLQSGVTNFFFRSNAPINECVPVALPLLVTLGSP